jgi:hypothetical protein
LTVWFESSAYVSPVVIVQSLCALSLIATSSRHRPFDRR